MLCGDPGQQSGQPLRPETFAGSDHVGDQEDGGRCRGLLQDREGEFMIVRPAVVEGDCTGLRREGAVGRLAFQPVGQLDDIEIAMDQLQVLPEDVRCYHHARFLDTGAVILVRQDAVIHQHQELRCTRLSGPGDPGARRAAASPRLTMRLTGLLMVVYFLPPLPICFGILFKICKEIPVQCLFPGNYSLECR